MGIKTIAHKIINGVLLKPFGLKIIYSIGSNPLDDIVRLMRGEEIGAILDGGAYKGYFSKAMATAFPHAKVHAFEPTPASQELLRKNVLGFPNIEISHFAIGVRSEKARFYENVSPLTNSLRKSSELGHLQFPDFVTGEEEIEVDVIRLADFAAERAITAFDIVKLDLQGNELDALIGAENLIAGVKIALIEVQFTSLYEGSPLFSEIEIFLREKGLNLFQLYDLVRSPDDGRLLYGDALFVNESVDLIKKTKL
jgi:FkbM family methyltransferase